MSHRALTADEMLAKTDAVIEAGRTISNLGYKYYALLEAINELGHDEVIELARLMTKVQAVYTQADSED